MPTSKPKKVSSELLERITNSLQLNSKQIQLLRDEGIAVGGTRRNTARYFLVNDTKVLPSFSYKGIGENTPTPEMNELRSKVDKLIDEYTTSD